MHQIPLINKSMVTLSVLAIIHNYQRLCSVMRVSWNAEYRGKAPLHLELAIRNMNSSRTPTQVYANMIAIIQSSGTGESRMVDQVFTFNLGDPAEMKRKSLDNASCTDSG